MGEYDDRQHNRILSLLRWVPMAILGVIILIVIGPLLARWVAHLPQPAFVRPAPPAGQPLKLRVSGNISVVSLPRGQLPQGQFEVATYGKMNNEVREMNGELLANAPYASWLGPNDVPLEITGGLGSITVTNHAAPLTVHGNIGDITIRDQTGPITIQSNINRITAEKVVGSVEILNAHDASLSNIKGDVRIQGWTATIRLARISGKVSINGKNDQVDLNDQSGVETVIEDCRQATLNAVRSRVIELRRVRQLTVEDSTGSLKISGSKAGLFQGVKPDSIVLENCRQCQFTGNPSGNVPMIVLTNCRDIVFWPECRATIHERNCTNIVRMTNRQKLTTPPTRGASQP